MSPTPPAGVDWAARWWRRHSNARSARGCRRIELDVDEENHPAVALYESLGFASGTGPGERNLFMRRRF